MKHKVAALVLALAFAAGGALAQAPAPPEVSGIWRGAVEAEGASLPIVIHIDATATGDSPDEQVFRVPGKLEHVGESYRVTFQSGGVFEGRLTKEGKLSGTYSKEGQSVPLVLEREAPPKP